MAGAGLAQGAITDDPVQVSDQVFRAGVEYCNSAAKASRTDGKQARSDFSLYLSHLERASAVYPALLEHNTFARRESQRCQQVGDDIARAEALPVMEKGLAMCQDARSALREGNLKNSRIRFSQYEMNRDRAVRLSGSVLRVGSIAVQVRMCDGLTDKIAALANQPAAVVHAPVQPALSNQALVHTGSADL